MTTTADLIRWFVGRVPGAGRTQLVGLLYLADHEARRFVGRPIPDIEWIRGSDGPHNDGVLVELGALRGSGALREEAHGYFPASEFACPFDDRELLVLDYIVKRFGPMTADAQRNFVYSTKPMIDANSRNAFGPMRMDLVDGEERRRGYDIDRILKSIRQLDQGLGIPLSEVWNELSGRRLAGTT